MNVQLQTRPANEFGDDFFEIKNIALHPAQADALKLLQVIGLKTPLLFGGSVRDIVHGLPFKDVDALGSYRDIADGNVQEVATEIEARLAKLADVTDILTRIKFNYHTGGQQVIVQCKHKGVEVDATLEETQVSIHAAQKRENVTLSGAYITHDGRIIAHQSFLDAIAKQNFKIVKYRSAKQFLIAIERFVRLRKRQEYQNYKFRIDIRECFRNRGTTLREPLPSLAGIFKHAKRLVARAKLHDAPIKPDGRGKAAKPDEPRNP